MQAATSRSVLLLRRTRTHAAAAVHIDPLAHVHPTARLAPGVIVLAGAYVGPHCELRSGSIIGERVHVGRGSVVGMHATLEHCRIGSQCMLHCGVKIGADGFGFNVEANGSISKKLQLRSVVIGSSVEVGAGSCIDRGSWRDTTLGDNTKVDNLVQIGHNVLVGRSCLICAHSALGGSAELGDHCIMGGKSAIADHVIVCPRVRLAAGSGVTKHITVSGDYAGFPAQPANHWRREVATMRAIVKRNVS